MLFRLQGRETLDARTYYLKCKHETLPSLVSLYDTSKLYVIINSCDLYCTYLPVRLFAGPTKPPTGITPGSPEPTESPRTSNTKPSNHIAINLNETPAEPLRMRAQLPPSCLEACSRIPIMKRVEYLHMCADYCSAFGDRYACALPNTGCVMCRMHP